YVTNERSRASTDTLSASSISLLADAGLRGITWYMVRPARASCIGISQQWRAYLRDGNSASPTQVTSITAKDESMNLSDLADRQEFGFGPPAAPAPSMTWVIGLVFV